MTTLSSSWTKITLSDGDMNVHITTPTRIPVRGAIVMLHEIFGVNRAMRQKAGQFAEAGYLVAMPDLFWRIERQVDLGYGEEDRLKGFGLMQKFSFEKGVDDVVALGAWVDEQPQRGGRVATLGFCIGGKLAVLAGANEPFKAAVALYGVKLDESADLLKKYPIPLQIHVGDQDTHIPLEARRKVEEALRDSFEGNQFIYAGAQHGFFNPLRVDTYEPQAAELAGTRVIGFLNKVLT